MGNFDVECSHHRASAAYSAADFATGVPCFSIAKAMALLSFGLTVRAAWRVQSGANTASG